MCRAHAEKAITVANGQVSHARAPSKPLTCLQSCLQSCNAFICACSGNGILLWRASRLVAQSDCCAMLRSCSLLSACQVVGGRTIAVDWAVSKTQYKSASAADSPGERTAS